MENKKTKGIVWAIVAILLVLGAAAAIFITNSGVISAQPETGDNITFTLEVILDGSEKIFSDEVTVPSGTSLIDAMSESITENGSVVYTDGTYGAYITSICGYSEDYEASKYWVYSINGESAMCSASDYYPANGDIIVFDLSVLTW